MQFNRPTQDSQHSTAHTRYTGIASGAWEIYWFYYLVWFGFFFVLFLARIGINTLALSLGQVVVVRRRRRRRRRFGKRSALLKGWNFSINDLHSLIPLPVGPSDCLPAPRPKLCSCCGKAFLLDRKRWPTINRSIQ